VSTSVRTALDIVVDIPLAELEQDPYPCYVRMREECPVAYVPETGRVWITTWDLCQEAGVNDAVVGPSSQASADAYGAGNLTTLTGEAHRVLRNAAYAPVRPRAIKAYYGSGIRATTRRYLGDIRGRGELYVDYGRDQGVADRGRAAKAEIRAYLEARLPRLLAEPDDTALSRLMHDGMPDGQVRSAAEILPTVNVLIVGGVAEPAHLIASTLYGLLANPGELQQAWSEPVTWSRPAIEEGLRWLPPFGMTEKRTTQDVTVGGVLIPAGTEIALVIGSANRDPERFGRPDEFDIDRGDQGNLAFGFGSHFCIGHQLTRALGEVVLAETLQALPGLRLDPGRAPVVSGWTIRAPKPLPVLWDAVRWDA